MGIVVSDIMRFRRWITLLSVLMVLTVSVIAFSTSLHNNVGNEKYVLYYEITAKGDEGGIGRNIIMHELEKVVNLSSLKVGISDINFLVFIHRDSLKNNKRINIVNESSKSCMVFSKDTMLIINGLKDGDIVNAKLTLSFRDGIAKCGKEFNALPKVDSRWVLRDDYYVTKFKYLNITKPIVINLRTLNVFNKNGEWLGDWIFHIPRSKLSRKSYEVLVYSIEELMNLEFDTEKPLHGGVNLLYLELYNNDIRLVGYSCNFSNNIVRILQQPHEFIGVKNDEVLDLMDAIKSKMAEVMKACNISELPMSYDEDQGKLILFDIIYKISSELSDNKVWKFIPNLFSKCSTIHINNHELGHCQVYPGISYSGKYYVAAPLSMSINLSYNSDGVLQSLKLYSDLGFIYGYLPSVISREFNVFNVYMVKSWLHIKLVNP